MDRSRRRCVFFIYLENRRGRNEPAIHDSHAISAGIIVKNAPIQLVRQPT